MDLETMRAKVDAHLYPTYAHFLYDLEQILHNAKLYNPADSTWDTRGRSIISAANQMIDAVESHAYYNVQIMKYNVFKKCEEAYYQRYFRRPSSSSRQSLESNSSRAPKRYNLRHSRNVSEDTPPSSSKSAMVPPERGANKASDIEYLKKNRDVMPTENMEFYEHILERHRDLSRENQEVEEEKSRAVSTGSSPCSEGEIVSVEKTAGVELSEDKGGNDDDNDDNDDNGGGEEEGSKENQAEDEFQNLHPVDLSCCPLIEALETAAEAAQEDKKKGIFTSFFKRCVACTSGWSISELVAMYSSKSLLSFTFICGVYVS